MGNVGMRLPIDLFSGGIDSTLTNRDADRRGFTATICGFDKIKGRNFMQRAGAPATVFIATGYVGERREFWWDELARIILESDCAIDGEISVAGQRHHVRLRTKPRSTRR